MNTNDMKELLGYCTQRLAIIFVVSFLLTTVKAALAITAFASVLAFVGFGLTYASDFAKKL